MSFATAVTTATTSIATPAYWWITLVAVVALIAIDFLITRKAHEVSLKEAITWSVIYLTLPLVFGLWLWKIHGGAIATEFYTGFIVEKSLSVDNLFVFLLILTSFAVPAELQQRVLLFGVIGALVLRGVFIALGAKMIDNFSFAFLIFGLILLVTAVKVFKDALGHGTPTLDISKIRSVQIIRKFWEVTPDYRGTAMTVQENGKRILTPLAVVVAAIFGTDVIFAIDSVPAVYGITSDPYLVFVTNACALFGLRALYFVVQGALSALRHLSYGLAIILAFISFKLIAHWAHDYWTWVPEVPTNVSLLVILGVLATVTATSLLTRERTTTTPG